MYVARIKVNEIEIFNLILKIKILLMIVKYGPCCIVFVNSVLFFVYGKEKKLQFPAVDILSSRRMCVLY